MTCILRADPGEAGYKNIFSRIDGIWIGNRIYWTLTSRDYNLL
jgi:hypothetical protein